jgi:hypothetical protein
MVLLPVRWIFVLGSIYYPEQQVLRYTGQIPVKRHTHALTYLFNFPPAGFFRCILFRQADDWQLCDGIRLKIALEKEHSHRFREAMIQDGDTRITVLLPSRVLRGNSIPAALPHHQSHREAGDLPGVVWL